MRARVVLSAHILCCDKWRRKTGGKGYYDGIWYYDGGGG
jgi:hypothetical protein